ncbi:histidine ammonia-lyase [Hoeflea sp. AS16]|uniref:histidine ammonia-lyase n=1 Tax=Hoeflea sp. AS16 TaxID=3135779 RepID=UPI003173702A
MSVGWTPGEIPLSAWRNLFFGAGFAGFAEGTKAQVDLCQQTVMQMVDGERAVYGVNTGFGKLAHIRIAPEQTTELQRRLIMSHSVGTGPLLDDAVVRLVLVLKANALAQGHSGIRWSVIELLLELVAKDVLPAIPSKGSVGASGDLAPLSHMVATLMGEGDMRVKGELVPAAEALAAIGRAPIDLGPKEGVALINGTQVSTALALKGLFMAEDLLRSALVTGALSVDACKGSTTPFDARIHAVRRQQGQQQVAGVYRRLLDGSAIRASHLDCEKVQDPYCLRCQPQVMGACLDQLEFAGNVLGREANSISDNPLVFPDTGEIISGGNFHAEPVAMAADNIALAIAEIGSISERRQAMMVDASVSGLPAFLASESGLNSGFMMAQVTSAALVSENKALAHPSSVDSIPTSANQEDHVSMATYAARRLTDMAQNCRMVIAIEWMAAAQGLEFHKPLQTAAPLQSAVAALRSVVPSFERDRFFAPEMEKAATLLAGNTLSALVTEPVGASYQ